MRIEFANLVEKLIIRVLQVRESTSLKRRLLMLLSQRRGSAISPCAFLCDAMSDIMRVTVISDRNSINRARIGLDTVIVRIPLDCLPMQIEVKSLQHCT